VHFVAGLDQLDQYGRRTASRTPERGLVAAADHAQEDAIVVDDNDSSRPLVVRSVWWRTFHDDVFDVGEAVMNRFRSTDDEYRDTGRRASARDGPFDRVGDEFGRRVPKTIRPSACEEDICGSVVDPVATANRPDILLESPRQSARS